MTKKQSNLIILSVALVACVAIFFSRGAGASRLAASILLKSGRPMQFGDYTVLIDKVDGNKLYGIKVSGKNMKLEAKSGEYAYLPEQKAIKLNLIDGSGGDFNPEHPEAYRLLTFKQSSVIISLDRGSKKER